MPSHLWLLALSGKASVLAGILNNNSRFLAVENGTFTFAPLYSYVVLSGKSANLIHDEYDEVSLLR